jgi:hypothetical protein
LLLVVVVAGVGGKVEGAAEEEEEWKDDGSHRTNSQGGTAPRAPKARAASIRTAVSSALNSLLPLPPPP